MNWMMVEEYLKRDNRAVLPLGSTEQHAYLSLSVDSILAERLAVEAAEPLGVPVFPVLAYGITPYFRAFPGTITLRVETCAESLGAGAGDRSCRFARVVDGKFSLDAFGKDRDAVGAEADERFRETAPARSEIAARISQGRQLRRPLSARQRRNDRNLAHRRGRNARAADGRVGLKGNKFHSYESGGCRPTWLTRLTSCQLRAWFRQPGKPPPESGWQPNLRLYDRPKTSRNSSLARSRTRLRFCGRFLPARLM